MGWLSIDVAVSKVALLWIALFAPLCVAHYLHPDAINTGFFTHYGDFKSTTSATYINNPAAVAMPIEICVLDKAETTAMIVAYANSDPFVKRDKSVPSTIIPRNDLSYRTIEGPTYSESSAFPDGNPTPLSYNPSFVVFAVVSLLPADKGKVLWHDREHISSTQDHFKHPYVAYLRCDTDETSASYGGATTNNPVSNGRARGGGAFNNHQSPAFKPSTLPAVNNAPYYAFSRSIKKTPTGWQLQSAADMDDQDYHAAATNTRMTINQDLAIYQLCGSNGIISNLAYPAGCGGQPLGESLKMNFYLVNRYDDSQILLDSHKSRNWSPHLIVTAPQMQNNYTNVGGFGLSNQLSYLDENLGTACDAQCLVCDCVSGPTSAVRDSPEMGLAIIIDTAKSGVKFGKAGVSFYVLGETYVEADNQWRNSIGYWTLTYDPSKWIPNSRFNLQWFFSGGHIKHWSTWRPPGDDPGTRNRFFMNSVIFSSSGTLYISGTWVNDHASNPPLQFDGSQFSPPELIRRSTDIVVFEMDPRRTLIDFRSYGVYNDTGGNVADLVPFNEMILWQQTIGTIYKEGVMAPQMMQSTDGSLYADMPCTILSGATPDQTTCNHYSPTKYEAQSFWRGATRGSMDLIQTKEQYNELWGVGYQRRSAEKVSIFIWKVRTDGSSLVSTTFETLEKAHANNVLGTSRGIYILGETEGEVVGSFTGKTQHRGGKDIFFLKYFHCEPGRSAIYGFFTECRACPPGLYNDVPYGLDNCKLCAPGTFNPVTSASVCTECPAGFFADGPASSFCKACDVGYESKFAGGTECTICTTGQYSSGGEPCQFCPPKTYQDEAAQGDCKTCPMKSSSGFGAMGVDFCACLDNEFGTPFGGDGVPVTECRACPLNTQCEPGMLWPVAEAGYWVSSTDYSNMIECSPSRACPGGIEECSDGYTGDGCNECVFGYYREMGVCMPCPAADNRIIIAAGTVIFVVFGSIVGCLGCCLWYLFRKQIMFVWYMYKRLKGIVRVIGMELAYIQVLMSLFSLGLEVPNVVDLSLALGDILPFEINLGFGKPECSSKAIHYGHKFVVKVAWPVLFAFFGTIIAAFFAIIIGQFVVAIGRRKAKLEKREHTMNMYTVVENFVLWWTGFLFNFINILLFALLSTGMEPFRCIKVDETTWSMVTEASVTCYSSDEKWVLAVPFALTSMIVYGVMFPIMVAIFVFLHRKKSRRDPKKLQYRVFYWLWEKYEQKYFYWELVTIMKKWVMVMTLLLAAQGPAEQAFLLYIVNLIFMALTVYNQPYIYWQDDAIDTVATTVIMVAVTGSLCIDSQTMQGPDEVAVALSILILMVLQFIVLIVLMGHLAFHNIKDMIHENKAQERAEAEEIERRRSEPIPIQLNLRENVKQLNSHRSIFRSRDGSPYFMRMSWQGTPREFNAHREKFISHFCLTALAFIGTTKLKKVKASKSQEEFSNILVSVKEDVWLHNVSIGWRLDFLAKKGELNVSQAVTNPDMTFDVAFLKYSPPEEENLEKIVLCNARFECVSTYYLMGTDTLYPDLKTFFETHLDNLVAPGLIGPDVQISHIDDISKNGCVAAQVYMKMGVMAAWRLEACCACGILKIGVESTPENPQPIPEWRATSKLKIVKKSDFPDDDKEFASKEEAKKARDEAKKRAFEASLYDSKAYEAQVRKERDEEKQAYVEENLEEMKRRGEEEEVARKKAVLTEYGMEYLKNDMNTDILTSTVPDVVTMQGGSSDGGSSRRGPRGPLRLQVDYGKHLGKEKIDKILDRS